MVVVVYGAETKEVLAIIDTDGDSICRDDVAFREYDGSEPILVDFGGKIYLDEYTTIYHDL